MYNHIRVPRCSATLDTAVDTARSIDLDTVLGSVLDTVLGTGLEAAPDTVPESHIRTVRRELVVYRLFDEVSPPWEKNPEEMGKLRHT